MFKINELFKTKQFLNALSLRVNNLIRLHDWTKEEKEIVKGTLDNFNIMLKVQLYENQHVEDKNKYDKKNLFYNRSKNWQKQQVYLSSKNIDKTKKNSVYNKEPPAHKSTEIRNSSRSLQLGISENDLNSIDPKKFEKQYSSSENLHVVSIKNESTFKPIDGKGNDRFRHKKKLTMSKK
jgi:hypothetical protein